MAPRRSHRKSRLGCANCKRRRIKCDEQKPACSNCVKHDIRCDFVSSQADLVSPAPCTSPAAVSPASPNPADVLLTNGSHPAGLNVVELELMHHYITVSCDSYANGMLLRPLWTTVIPQIGFSHPFVLQFIFSITAFHLARLRPDRHAYYVQLAEEYHSAALSRANELLPHLSPENAEALYVSAGFIVSIAFARGPRPGDYLVFGDHGPSEALVLIRGTRSIIELQQETLFSGRLSTMFKTAGRKLSTTFNDGPPPDVNEHVRALREYVTGPLAAEDPNAETYRIAFDDLTRSIGAWDIALKTAPEESQYGNHYVFVWIYRLSQDYILCLQQHQPVALVIFAYFVVLLHRLRTSWYVEGWTHHIMGGICSYIPDDYKHWIRWPAEEIGWILI